MSEQQSTTDEPRPVSVLEPLTVLETAYFLQLMVDADEKAETSIDSDFWRELQGMRKEARSLFERKFFEVN